MFRPRGSILVPLTALVIAYGPGLIAQDGDGPEASPPSGAPSPGPQESGDPRDPTTGGSAPEGREPAGSTGVSGSAVPETEETGSAEPSAESDVPRTLGPNLFPFYIHERRPSDGTEILQILGLYRRERRPDGSGSTMLLPFYYQRHSLDPPDDRLYLFPFYFQRDSEDISFRYLLPFWYDRRTPERRWRFLAPIWLNLTTHDGQLERHHVLWPLFRFTQDRRLEDRPVTAVRLGIPKLLELFEHRHTPHTTDTTALNLLNWREEAQSGLPLYLSSWIREDWGYRGQRHLFPFYWQGAGAESGYFWLVPFFGWSADGGRRDVVLFPLLSRWGSGPGDALRLDLLFPLFHWAEGRDDEFSVASFPFFEYHRAEDHGRTAVLFWLWRRYWSEEDGQRDMFLYPLSYFSRSPDERRGYAWFVPYASFWNEERSVSFLVPAFYHQQSYSDGVPGRFFTYGVPTYFAWGLPDDWFALGFPLYWADREGDDIWRVLFPLYWDFRTRISRDFHLIPFFSYRSAPHRRQYIAGGPLYAHERFYDLDEELQGTAHHVLWPFFKLQREREGWELRLLPLFWLRRTEDVRASLITPFYYQQSGPEGTARYLFPFYARFTTPRETREFAAAGFWSRHRVRDDAGTVTRERTDWMWGLATSLENRKAGLEHRRVLPVGYWETESPSKSRRILGPLWYSHRIVEERQVHRLRLLLGNLFLSKTVDGPARPAQRTPAPPTGETGDGPADSARADAPAATGDASSWTRRSWDRGVLWPLSRFAGNARGDRTRWILPFWASTRSPSQSSFALFPLWYDREETGAHQPSFFRYFFLVDRERWATGWRWSLGQVLFDLRHEETDDAYRLRLLYPLFQLELGKNSFRYSITPIISGESVLEGGERSSRHSFFPLFWSGSRERLDDEGNWQRESDHFYLFPLWGYERRATRTDWRVLYPLLHVHHAPESFSMELWPFWFYRDNPALHAARVWPLHAQESGEAAGEFWVSRYLFLSKHFRRGEETTYRLDPFLFRWSSGPERFGVGGLFEAFAYDRGPEGTSYRAIPFVFGQAGEEGEQMAVIPFHYREEFAGQPIDYWSWPRFFFLTSSLRGGNGERHFSILTKLFDYTDNPRRPEYSELRVLHRFIFHYRTEDTVQIEWNPFFQYFRDDAEGTSSLSLLFSLYQRETTPDGRTEHTLFYFIPF